MCKIIRDFNFNLLNPNLTLLTVLKVPIALPIYQQPSWRKERGEVRSIGEFHSWRGTHGVAISRPRLARGQLFEGRAGTKNCGCPWREEEGDRKKKKKKGGGRNGGGGAGQRKKGTHRSSRLHLPRRGAAVQGRRSRRNSRSRGATNNARVSRLKRRVFSLEITIDRS